MLKFEELPMVNSDRWLSIEDFEDEIWKVVPEYGGLMLASNYGRIALIRKNDPSHKMIVKQYKNRDPYYLVAFKGMHLVHRIIAKTFIPNSQNKPCVDHIDTNNLNNMVDNLKWVTHKENVNNPLTKKHIIEERKNRKGGVYSRKKIAKIDMNGCLICTYNSVTEAASKNNISISHISKTAHFKESINKYKHHHGRTAGGFYWRYIE